MTRTGWIVLGSGAILYVAGWLVGYPELIMLAAACFIALIVALVWVRSRSSLDVRREIEPPGVPKGDLAMGLVNLTNRGTRPVPALVARETLGSRRDRYPVTSTGGGSKPDEHIPPAYRAPRSHPGGSIAGCSQDPFALMRSGREYGTIETLFVHPRTHPISPLPSSRLRDLEGPTSDTAPQGTVTFHRLREYVAGDDRRQIHWKSTARLGRLMVRHQVDTSQPHTTVLLDTRADRYASDDEFETAVDLAASIAVASSSRNFPGRTPHNCRYDSAR